MVLSDTARHRQAWPAAAVFSPRFRDEHPDKVAEYMPYFARHPAPPWTGGWQALAVACFGRRGSLARVRASTLVLHGGHDAMAPVGNARLLADGIPNAELHVVPDAGHAVPLEQPAASAQLRLGRAPRRRSAGSTSAPRPRGRAHDAPVLSPRRHAAQHRRRRRHSLRRSTTEGCSRLTEESAVGIRDAGVAWATT
jgi:hypothetical protein